MMKNLFSIYEKVVIITGAGRSIGYNLAIGLAKCSAKIYSLDKKFTRKISKNLSHLTYLLAHSVYADFHEKLYA